MSAENLYDHYTKKKVLITGGLGFIGSNLAIKLVEAGAEVTILDSLIPGLGGERFNISPVESKVKVNISDMRDIPSLRILLQGQEYIFHLAGQVSHGDSMKDPEMDLAVNCVSTINLVEACRCMNPTARLIYTSTRQVYGVPLNLPVTEDHPVLPIDVNGINKLAAEYYHLLYNRTYGLKSVVLRLTNTYGPRQQIRNNRQGFIGIFLRQAFNGETIKVFGNGKQVRDFNYIDDVTDALMSAAVYDDCYGHVFNLGFPRHYSLLELIGALDQLCGVKYEIVPFPSGKGIIDIGDYYGDYSRFAEITGWRPEIDLSDGLSRTVEFYRKHEAIYIK